MSIRDALNEVGLTFYDLLGGVLLVLVFVFCLFCLGAAIYATTSPRASVSRSDFGVTFKHDDHLWFRAYGGSAVHHPDCPCLEAK